jgi:hypothetical protein
MAYPNPGSDYLEVAFTDDARTNNDSIENDSPEANGELPEAYELAIYNAYSEKVKVDRSKEKKKRYDVSLLPPGVYYLHVTFQGKTTRRQWVRKP